ncbi:MAG: P27 family phage terminase small subunit [Bacteroides sp.]|nr:P27 family phage terminase small subunit [Eubacterium sp.]MCM1419292.1 P27 family phage terminase small subunit [Roseburia sp.]MCM1463420.1 P27 family phage terminase small subunit [Bacteroides sp.]
MRKEERSKKEVREELINQLKAKGAETPFFVGLVEDYVFLYEKSREIQKDIRQRGAVYEEVYNSYGSATVKIHPGIKELTTINRQMLAILKQLNLTTENIVTEENSDF